MPKQARTRQKNLMLRMSDEERDLVERLSRAVGLSMADTLRQALRNEANRYDINVTGEKRNPRRK
jgi:hypothetical protein